MCGVCLVWFGVLFVMLISMIGRLWLWNVLSSLWVWVIIGVIGCVVGRVMMFFCRLMMISVVFVLRWVVFMMGFWG